MGGDTVTEVEVTNQAIYVGGHFRWANYRTRPARWARAPFAARGLAASTPATDCR